MEKLKEWIWFSCLDSLNPIKKYKLIKKYKEPKNIINLEEQKLKQVSFLTENNIKNILDNQIKNKLDSHIKYLKEHKIKLITINDLMYPKELKQIYDPPVVLYVVGNISILNKTGIAIVGCRDNSIYGKKIAKQFSYGLAKKGLVVISGLAKGIDSYAHQGAIMVKGETIAVLGNGLHTIYPKENEMLAKQIIQKNGCIISEYPLGVKPLAYHFPARNRIISGLSKAVLVIEAKEKSGTLITVDFALEQGKEVFCIPGNIDSIKSVGTNKLIKQGAKLVTNENEILEEIYTCQIKNLSI